MENGWLIFIFKKTNHYLLIIRTLRNSGIVHTQLRKAELRKCGIAKFCAKWLAQNCAKCCFFALKFYATKANFCVLVRKNCVKVLRTKTLTFGNPSKRMAPSFIFCQVFPFFKYCSFFSLLLILQFLAFLLQWSFKHWN